VPPTDKKSSLYPYLTGRVPSGYRVLVPELPSLPIDSSSERRDHLIPLLAELTRRGVVSDNITAVPAPELPLSDVAWLRHSLGHLKISSEHRHNP
jgi:hypothetical protein